MEHFKYLSLFEEIDTLKLSENDFSFGKVSTKVNKIFIWARDFNSFISKLSENESHVWKNTIKEIQVYTECHLIKDVIKDIPQAKSYFDYPNLKIEILLIDESDEGLYFSRTQVKKQDLFNMLPMNITFVLEGLKSNLKLNKALIICMVKNQIYLFESETVWVDLYKCNIKFLNDSVIYTTGKIVLEYNDVPFYWKNAKPAAKATLNLFKKKLAGAKILDNMHQFYFCFESIEATLTRLNIKKWRELKRGCKRIPIDICMDREHVPYSYEDCLDDIAAEVKSLCFPLGSIRRLLIDFRCVNSDFVSRVLKPLTRSRTTTVSFFHQQDRWSLIAFEKLVKVLTQGYPRLDCVEFDIKRHEILEVNKATKVIWKRDKDVFSRKLRRYFHIPDDFQPDNISELCKIMSDFMM